MKNVRISASPIRIWFGGAVWVFSADLVKWQHDDDPRKRGHHDNNGRCQCDQRQSDQNPKRTVDLSVTVIVGNADSIRRIQLSYSSGVRGCSRPD